MVLCEIANLTASPLVDFAITWGVLTLLGGVSMALLSGSVFWLYYANPTYERWQRKHNPEFPTAKKVRLEIRQMLKSLMAATLVPAATLLLSQERFRHLGLTQAYCGLAPPQGMAVPWGLSPAAYLAAQFAVFWVASDFFEWGYHQIGHRFSWCWAIHRHHHVCACGARVGGAAAAPLPAHTLSLSPHTRSALARAGGQSTTPAPFQSSATRRLTSWCALPRSFCCPGSCPPTLTCSLRSLPSSFTATACTCTGCVPAGAPPQLPAQAAPARTAAAPHPHTHTRLLAISPTSLA